MDVITVDDCFTMMDQIKLAIEICVAKPKTFQNYQELIAHVEGLEQVIANPAVQADERSKQQYEDAVASGREYMGMGG